MMHILRRSSTLIVMVFLIVACTPFISPYTEEMQSLGPKVDQLTKMVEAAVRYDGATLDGGERKLLELATKDEPGLLRWFDEQYIIKVDIKDHHAVILVCTKDGKQSLYEDTACKTGPDSQLWQKPAKCVFTISESVIQEFCN